jgi:ribosomal protein L37E
MKKRIRRKFKQINWSALNNIISNTPQKKEYVDNFRYCEYNKEVSEKFYKFLDLMLNIPFEFYNDNVVGSFSLNFNLNGYYNNNNNNNKGDEYLHIIINKNSFKISKNYCDVCGYNDENIFSLYEEKIKKNYELKSKQELDRVIGEVLDVIPSIGREYKIDELFND